MLQYINASGRILSVSLLARSINHQAASQQLTSSSSSFRSSPAVGAGGAYPMPHWPLQLYLEDTWPCQLNGPSIQVSTYVPWHGNNVRSFSMQLSYANQVIMPPLLMGLSPLQVIVLSQRCTVVPTRWLGGSALGFCWYCGCPPGASLHLWHTNACYDITKLISAR